MKDKYHIIPAIIAENQDDLTDRINKVKQHAGILQLDFMDGNFVPTRSIDFDFITPEYDGILEAHLMVSDPGNWMAEHAGKVDTILAPIESCREPRKTIEDIRGYGKKPGFVLNPETPLDAVRSFLDDIEQVLIMTVNPGYYGSPFLPETLEKVAELRQMKRDLNIEVDGGITPETIRLASDAGANMFVSGSFIVKAQDPGIAITQMIDKIKDD
ncbi:ribulose-phosphate 3-epimerase [Candidatus Altiarchaeota archaeon]